MGKKKFIDKKKSATFQLMARDSSDPNYLSDPSSDRVFVRVDNNQYIPDSFFKDENPNYPSFSVDPDSIFANAPEDCNDDEDAINDLGGLLNHESQTTTLPDHIRREILELGFPDDGYNYLAHLRDIKNTGGGSAYYHNPKADINKLPQDVKAYDASKVEVSKINDAYEKSIYSVASKTVGVKLQKVVDPEIAAMLDDSNSSKFGSDVEDLEEDFVVRANVLEGSVVEEIDEKNCAACSRTDHLQSWDSSVATDKKTRVSYLDDLKTRIRRPLDEQFDLLELNEYGDESEEEHFGYMDEEECQESLAEKLNNALKDHQSNLLHLQKELVDDDSPELTAEVIQRCKEYAEKYEGVNDDQEEVLVEESSDKSEAWDCETIISTYSTLDNHPGKIGAPEMRKKKLAEALSGSSAGAKLVIELKGKERFPVDFLPCSRKGGEVKSKDEKAVNDKRSELQKKKPRCQESKEEKKERKSTVKQERREARQMKKEIKALYKSEANRAQQVAAFTGPSSIHLM